MAQLCMAELVEEKTNGSTHVPNSSSCSPALLAEEVVQEVSWAVQIGGEEAGSGEKTKTYYRFFNHTTSFPSSDSHQKNSCCGSEEIQISLSVLWGGMVGEVVTFTTTACYITVILEHSKLGPLLRMISVRDTLEMMSWTELTSNGK